MIQRDIDRFWRRVRRGKSDDCWTWTAGISSSGYGAFYVAGKQIGAHRMAALVAAGHSDKYVLHSCDNKLCCNPRHLRYGTQQENLQEMMDKGRWKRTKPATKGYRNHLRGADVWTSTLTESLVRQIWKLHLRGKNAGEIAKITGASNQAIGSLCRGKTWRHLSGAPSVEKLAQGGVRRSKLSESDIKEIRQLIKSGETNVSIAARFGISTAPVSNIRNHGSTWVPKP